MTKELVFTVTDFVAVFNQTLEVAYPSVVISGELTNFRVSKGRWIYFDLKDELASLKFFGTVYNLPGPLEDGMMLQVRGQPRLHPLYGFSVNIQTIQPVGEGTIKRAAQLLEAKLAAEGLFEASRKRPLPYPPTRVGLIASSESAAYHDFVKILDARWGGVTVELVDIQVQGELAPAQIIGAIEQFNQAAEPPEVLVIARGGGSPEDLAAFSAEPVVRAVAASRIPTMVAIGHEIDVSLAELAADQRASTPSNAAELLVPDKRSVTDQLIHSQTQLTHAVDTCLRAANAQLKGGDQSLFDGWRHILRASEDGLALKARVLDAFNPQAALQRGYAIVRDEAGKVVRTGRGLKSGQPLSLKLHDALIDTTIKKVRLQ